MPEFTAATWVALAVCAFLVAVSKTGIPGIGILVVVLLLYTLPARMSVGFLLPILIAGDIIALAWFRQHAVWSHVLRLLPWAVAGILAGFFALGKVDDRQLQRVIGVIVIVLLAVETWRNSRKDAPVPTHWLFAAVIGVLAGFTTMMANAAGPLIVIYFLAMRLDKHEFVGTSAWYFIILNTFKVPFMVYRGMITPETVKINAMLLPAIAVGGAAGILVLRRIPQKWFVVVVKVLTLLAAIWLLIPKEWFGVTY